MTHQWMLKTDGDPLRAARRFLRGLFQQAGLDSLLVPVQVNGSIEPRLVEDPDLLETADPFTPLMTVNTARMAVRACQRNAHRRLGLVMRACEIRALLQIAQQEKVDLGRTLIIGIDCMGTLPLEHLAWRNGIDDLRRETLHFARQGGVAVYRFRPACQMCIEPMPEAADLTLDFLGLPTGQALMITLRDQDLALPLHLETITDGPAPASLIAQHEDIRGKVLRRRKRARQRILERLDTDLAPDIDALVEHLANCQPCQACLEVCPVAAGLIEESGGQLSTDLVSRWLVGCAGCGMCEEACPEHLPLTRIFARLREELLDVLDETAYPKLDDPLSQAS